MGVDGRRRGKAYRPPDLAHRRRVAVPVDVVDEEAPDLALPAGQLGCRLHLTLRGRGLLPNKCSTAGYALLRTTSIRQIADGEPDRPRQEQQREPKAAPREEVRRPDEGNDPVDPLEEGGLSKALPERVPRAGQRSR